MLDWPLYVTLAILGYGIAIMMTWRAFTMAPDEILNMWSLFAAAIGITCLLVLAIIGSNDYVVWFPDRGVPVTAVAPVYALNSTYTASCPATTPSAADADLYKPTEAYMDGMMYHEHVILYPPQYDNGGMAEPWVVPLEGTGGFAKFIDGMGGLHTSAVSVMRIEHNHQLVFSIDEQTGGGAECIYPATVMGVIEQQFGVHPVWGFVHLLLAIPLVLYVFMIGLQQFLVERGVKPKWPGR